MATTQHSNVMPFSIPYPEAPAGGFWGKQTSTIDWCEENYVVSHYIAEAVNTVTNAFFVSLAIYAMRNVVVHGHEARFFFVAIGFMIVGIGSWLFHMTLLYEFQLLDELPMIYATCIPYWIVFSFGKDKRGSIKVAVQITTAAALLTGIYLYYRNPTIHQAGYGVLNAVVVLKSVMMTHQHVHDKQAQAHLKRTLIYGLSSFLLGYFLWNLDIHLCTTWRGWRRILGMPYGFFLEGHGWWHLLTGTGVYFYIVYLEYLRVFLIGKENDYVFKWSYGFPRVELKPEVLKALKQKKTQ